MARLAITFGLILTALGGGFYVYTEMKSVTALIPAFFGIGLILCGLVARNENLRKHAMHVAALIGLVGTLMPAFMVVKSQLIDKKEWGTATTELAAMAVLCGAFLYLCIKSFIDARKARKA